MGRVPIFVVATANAHKFSEIKAILARFRFSLKSLKDFPEVVPPEETGKTYEENAILKATAVCRALKALPVLADDSGIEIEALGGAPGIFSSRFLGEETSYGVKNTEILERMKRLPPAKRSAKFVCAAACAMPDGACFAVRGEVLGRIALEAKGKEGFGYDPIFFLPEFGKTMGELPREEKNKISHRAKAFRALAAQLGDTSH